MVVSSVKVDFLVEGCVLLSYTTTETDASLSYPLDTLVSCLVMILTPVTQAPVQHSQTLLSALDLLAT